MTRKPAPTTIPQAAIDHLTLTSDAGRRQDARILLRWHPDDPDGSDGVEIDWTVLRGDGTPASWYYSPTPVVSITVTLPDEHDVGQALSVDSAYPDEALRDPHARRDMARQLIEERIEQREHDLDRQVDMLAARDDG